MRVAVIGAGPAGLTAAARLRAGGADVVVYEREAAVGGRTRTIRFDNGHVLDAGAGWIGSFYRRYLAFLDDLGMRGDLVTLDMGAHAGLSEHGRRAPAPLTPLGVVRTGFLPWAEKARLVAWFVRLVWSEPVAHLVGDPRHDAEDAATYLRREVGPRAVDTVFRPAFSAVFSDLGELSAALVRSWGRAAAGARFFALAGGMDLPWRRVAGSLDVRVATPVGAVRVRPGGRVDVVPAWGEADVYDAVVAAGPLPEMLDVVSGWEPPAWFRDVRYAPHVRVYAMRAVPTPAADTHPLETDADVVSVSRGSGRLWGTCPTGRSAAVAGSAGPWSTALMDMPDGEAAARVWARARQVDTDLFALEEADEVAVIRWPYAVPVFAPGRFRRLADVVQRPPVVFAGDWLSQPCMEGAVRSGEAAARVLLEPG